MPAIGSPEAKKELVIVEPTSFANELLKKGIPVIDIGQSKVHSPASSQMQHSNLKFMIVPGNNANLIKRVFAESRSSNWNEVQAVPQHTRTPVSEIWQFKWAPISKQINF